MQTPCPEQLPIPAQVRSDSEQSGPWCIGSHTQVPFVSQTPWFVQLLRQCAVAQSGPEKPRSHAHVALMHAPRPVQLPGHSMAVKQSGPVHPGSHRHVALMQTPREVQFPGHSTG